MVVMPLASMPFHILYLFVHITCMCCQTTSSEVSGLRIISADMPNKRSLCFRFSLSKSSSRHWCFPGSSSSRSYLFPKAGVENISSRLIEAVLHLCLQIVQCAQVVLPASERPKAAGPVELLGRRNTQKRSSANEGVSRGTPEWVDERKAFERIACLSCRELIKKIVRNGGFRPPFLKAGNIPYLESLGISVVGLDSTSKFLPLLFRMKAMT